MHLNEALRTSKLISIPVHHEQAAAMSAEGYARASGKLGVCLVTSGPGASNLSTGLAGAFLDSTPVIAIIGQSKTTTSPLVASDGLRQSGLFELDNQKLLAPIIKGFFVINDSNVKQTVVQAVGLACSGRPGPVVIEVPLGIQEAPYVDNYDGESLLKLPRNGIASTNGEIRIPRLSSKFEKPVILAGHGVIASQATKSLLAFAGENDIPVVTTQLAKGAIPFSHKLFVGHSGPRGDRAGNHALQEADLLIAIGTSLGSQTTGYEISDFSPKSLKIVQDYESGVSGKNLNLNNVSFIALEIHDFIRSLSQEFRRINNRHSQTWNDSLRLLKESGAVIMEPHVRDKSGHNLYDFAHELSAALSEVNKDINVITDAGLCFYVMGQAFRLSEGQNYTVSGGLGAMGYALPSAIGQSQSHQQLTVAVSGDGSTQMNVQEFATLAALEANVIYFLINNNGYASIRNTQDSFFGQRIGSSEETGVMMPDWKKITQAYGIRYMRIGRRDKLLPAIERAIRREGPLLVEVMCQESQKIMPFVANYIDENGSLRSMPLNQMSPRRSPLPMGETMN